MKTSPIYLDRLEKALSAQGVTLKRSQLLETAAAAFGYHNSNEFSAAAKRGDLTPPAPKPVGRIALPDGQVMLVVTDTLSNSPYGIDESFIEQVVEDERAERIGVTPYGHLAFLGDLGGQVIPDIGTSAGGDISAFAQDIHTISCIDADDRELALEALSEIRGLCEQAKSGRAPLLLGRTNAAHPGGEAVITLHWATIDHRDGSDHYIADTREELIGKIAKHVAEFWGDVSGESDVPETTDGLTDQQIVDFYYGAATDESYRTGEVKYDLSSRLSGGPNVGGLTASASSVVIDRTTLDRLVDGAWRFVDDGANDLVPNVDKIDAAVTEAQALLAAQPAAPTSALFEVMSTADKQLLTIHTGSVDHRHGNNSYVAATSEGVLRQIAAYCVEWWHETPDEAPETADGLTDEEIISFYFDNNEKEFYSTSVEHLEIDEAFLSTLGISPATQPIVVDGAELPSASWLKDIAATLEDGASADIWFHAHDFPGEEGAAEKICEAQRAMSESARIFRALAAEAAQAPRLRSPQRAAKPEQENPIWLTGDDGDETHASDQRTFDRLGLSYTLDDGEFLALEANEYDVVRTKQTHPSRYDAGYSIMLGASALYAGKKWHAPCFDIPYGPEGGLPDIAHADAELARFIAAVEPSVKALDGIILPTREATDFSHEVTILLPFGIAKQASTPEDYFNALDFLINGQRYPSTPRIMAQFAPQAWVNNYAMEVDGEGEREFDATFEVLLIGEDLACALDDHQRDDIRYAHKAPNWVQNWSGPFEVYVTDSIREYFEDVANAAKPCDHIASIVEMTGTTASDWADGEGPDSRCGVDYYYDHVSGMNARVNDDQGHVSITVFDIEGEEVASSSSDAD